MRLHLPQRLRTLLGRGPRRNWPVSIVLPPDARVVQVVGDIHGRADLLADLVPRLDLDQPLVFAGDAIDRGPASQSVLSQLRQLEKRANVTCLMGNHEDMLLSFLADPERWGAPWLRAGGIETLESYGIDRIGRADTTQLRDNFAEALGGDLIEWLHARPAFIRFGTLIVVHAGLDPDQTPETEARKTLLWGHPSFVRTRRRDGLFVAHGHIEVATPEVRHNRIAVDTGAWRTGRLTAARISQTNVTFLTRSDS